MGRTAIAASEASSSQDADIDQMERLVGVGVSWKLTSQVFVQVIRLATVTILAHLLTPADYGAAAIAIALATFAPTLADMGMGSALVQTEKATQRVRSTTFWSALAFGIGLSAIFAALATRWRCSLTSPRSERWSLRAASPLPSARSARPVRPFSYGR